MSQEQEKRSHAFDLARKRAKAETPESRRAKRRQIRNEQLKPGMFWVLVLGFIIAIAILGLVVHWVTLSYKSSNYIKEVQLEEIYLSMDDSYLIASHGGENVRVLGQNLTRALQTVSVSDHRILSRRPSYREEEAIVLLSSDGSRFTVAPDPGYTGSKEKAIVIYEAGGKSTYLSIEGYKTMEWLSSVTGREGSYGPNQPVKIGDIKP